MPLYIPRREKISQGDIYRRAPSAYVDRRPLTTVRRETVAGARTVYVPYPENATEPAGGFKWEDKEDIVVPANRAHAVLLTHDCEVDKDLKQRYRTLALVRSTVGLQAAALHNIATRSTYRFFYLAPQDSEPQFAEHYVDFRRVTTVEQDALPEVDRVLSLSDDIRAVLALAYSDYITRTAEESA